MALHTVDKLYRSKFYCRSHGSKHRLNSLSTCTDMVRNLLGQKSIAVALPLHTGPKLYLVLHMGSFHGSLFRFRLLNHFTNISFTRISTTEELHNAMMLCEPELTLSASFNKNFSGS